MNKVMIETDELFRLGNRVNLVDEVDDPFIVNGIMFICNDYDDFLADDLDDYEWSNIEEIMYRKGLL